MYLFIIKTVRAQVIIQIVWRVRVKSTFVYRKVYHVRKKIIFLPLRLLRLSFDSNPPASRQIEDVRTIVWQTKWNLNKQTNKQKKIKRQGRETPSPGETPYMCRQRNSLARSTGSMAETEQQEVNEMERGHLLSPPATHHSVQLPLPLINSPTVWRK